MKRSQSALKQIVCLVPGTLFFPFVLLLLPTIFLDLADHTINLVEAIFALSIAVSILAGLVAAWSVILSGANRIRINYSLKATVEVALALGTFGGCSVLIWAVKFIAQDKSADLAGAILAILFWTLFLGTPVSVLTYQFVGLIRAVRPKQDRTSSS